MEEDTIHAAIKQILNSKKYRDLDIPEETVADLLNKEFEKGHKTSLAIKQVKKKMHNIIAPYLDTLDYAVAGKKIAEKRGEKATILSLCEEILRAHDSTRERLAYFPEFFTYIFSKAGENCTILDLACGLNPFFLPFVHLPANMEYVAYDIHGPRIDLLNQLFQQTGMRAKAIRQDIVVDPPREKACCVFLFKEAHRIEKRVSGGTRHLINALNAKHIFISLPTHSLNGKYDMRERMRRLVEEIITGIGFLEEVKVFASEMTFLIRKNDG